MKQSINKSTNHSARKTVVRKLREAGFAKCEVKNNTGHSREEGLDAYDSGNEKELHAMSTTISKNPFTKTNLSLQNNNNFSFGIPGPEERGKQTIINSTTSNTDKTIIFNNCTNICIGKDLFKAKRKRLRIYSSSDEE